MDNIYQTRRQKLVEIMEDDTTIILFANEEGTLYLPFLQDNNFYYLTGIKAPEAVFVLHKRNGKETSKLYIQRSNPEAVVWYGEKMNAQQASEISSIERILYLDEFEKTIYYELFSANKIYLKYDSKGLGLPLGRSLSFAAVVKERIPNLQFADINQKMSVLRSVKDSYEIDKMQTAIDATGEGLKRVMNSAKTGMMEYELEAMLFYEFRRRGLEHWGFQPIVATGKNGATLHYNKNNCRIEKGHLILLDVGAAYDNYSADITRTFPIEKKFSKRQKDVYSAVLRVQKEIISNVKPGMGMTELNKKAAELITEELKKLKLIKNDDEFRKYYMHSIGHHLGMDTHDLGARDSVLTAGNVITVEPGIYIPEEGIGVRIEDDLYVTESGNRVLSASIPKEVEELEDIRANALKK
ncbi:MAG: aminopeptidase P family protein [Candidatus Cloacimonetes bacterium]|nr:aminopeptidase P family protein [Candidatus Cloacimonadota bacterium]